MEDTALQAVIVALRQQDKAAARRLLRPLLSRPTADRWYMAGLLARSAPEAGHYLKRALQLDPTHARARQKLHTLCDSPPVSAPVLHDVDLPPLSDLVADSVALSDTAQSAAEIWVPLPKAPQGGRSIWFYVTVGSGLLLSLSLAYVVLLLLGSGVPGRLRALVTGQQPALLDSDETAIFATPVAVVDGVSYYGHSLAEIGDPESTPVRQIDGVPVYAVPDAVVVVAASKTSILTVQQAISDVLEPGFAHEYTFTARMGQELAIGVQFFSPFANQVSRNVAILGPDDANAETGCTRDHILQGDNGVAFICRIDRDGDWKLRLFGREGESSGVYVVALGVMGD